MSRKFFKNLLSLLVISGSLLAFQFVFAQDFGTAAVESGLGGALANDDPRTIVGRIINILLGFLGVIALGLLIYAGFLWMTSAGEEEKISRAKKLLVSAVIGLAIILASWAIATFVLNKLSGAIGGGGGSVCTEGSTRPCGCNGYMTCVSGSWEGCFGSDCSVYPPQKYCDGDAAMGGCQANSDICAPQDYCANDCTCQPRGEIGDPCDGDMETPTCDADNNLCSDFLACDQNTCTCFGPPVITGVSPAGGFCTDNINQSCAVDADCSTTCNKVSPNGAPDNFLTIAGKNFGEYEAGVSRVIFTGGGEVVGRNPSEINSICVNFWSDNQIIIAVPVGVSSGAIKVVRADGLEDTTDNDYGPTIPDFVANGIVRPGLCLLTPSSGELSTPLSYQGVNLYSGTAYFGSYQTNIQALDSNFSHPSGLSGTAAVPNARAGEATSFVISTLGGNQEKSNYLYFTKESDPKDGPFIISFSPTQGRSGQYVTIMGSGFGGAKGTSQVYFGDIEANYEFPAVCASSVWSDNQIIVKVPENISNDNYYIRVSLGSVTVDTTQLNPNFFRVDSALPLKTSVCKIDPQQGAVSTPVKVYGEYFGTLGQEGLVQFSVSKNAFGQIQEEGNADLIAVEVPGGAVTGPVKVVKNNEWGNSLNFSVANCVDDTNCPGQVCCPVNTYKKGRCVPTLSDCLIDIPNSVFEWNFSTGFATTDEIDPTESCETLASYFGSCQTGSFCPNASGVCSPYAGGNKRTVGTCDYSCVSIDGCGGLGSDTCFYDASINKCVKSGEEGVCSLPQTQTFDYNGVERTFDLTCNQDGYWQFSTTSSCPDGWEKGVNNVCVNKSSSCSSCADDFSCERVGTEGRCVSNTICPSGSICEDNPDLSSSDQCVILDQASCDCCCRIGNSAQDCCAPLECEGTCGQDQSDDGAGFGRCSGCANVGTTQAEHDAACNCAGNGGQYCSITPETPQGVCTDCSGLKTIESCSDHSSVCCFDAKRTITSTDDSCRGGSGTDISNDPSNPNFGYCAYFNCSASDPATCATNDPLKLGFFKDPYTCTDGCANGEGTDFCSLFSGNQTECMAAPTCCFDFATSQCKGGEQITSGAEAGYCAYYNCGDPEAVPPGDPEICDTTQRTTGRFNALTTCQARCGSGFGGAGMDCSSQVLVNECNFDICNYPGLACLTDSGSADSSSADCGVCCCNPAADTCKTPETPNLYCEPDKGNCTGADRGLCCGCENDEDCGNPATIGCGLDSCCEARPSVVESWPASGTENVCRNAVIRVGFDQIMDISTFNANTLLLREMEYGTGVCPAGTIAYNEIKIKNNSLLTRIFDRFKQGVSRLVSEIFIKEQTALAVLPDPSRLYCVTPINVAGSNSILTSTLEVMPSQLMAPDTNYFLVIKGDEELNSQLGVASIKGIGMNGTGLDGTEGELIKFNNTSYKQSQIIHFKTLSDKTTNSGVCAISSVRLTPASYLFKTTANSLDEKDDNYNDKTFDTVYDRDKVFSAWAYSADGQAIQPVTGYFWTWDFIVADTSVAAITPVTGIRSNQVLVAADNRVTEGETKLSATINMDNFLLNPNTDPSCVCEDQTCSANCMNAFSVGDDLNTLGNVYVFVCENPWPTISSTGEWSPWLDNCDNVVAGSCTDFSYKFYYCRDVDQTGTFDDLPAITTGAIMRGTSLALICSSDGSSCSSAGSLCGADRNGDGLPDGICVSSVLKESYFFREETLPAGYISEAVDTKLGGEVAITWRSSSDQAAAYKIYYGEAGRAVTNSREFSHAEACVLSGTEYICSGNINNLENGQAYTFRLSVLSANRAESALSDGRIATPTDQTAPAIPTNLQVIEEGDKVRFTWNSSDSSAKYFRLYRGVKSGLYGESFDSSEGSLTILLEKSSLSLGVNYFAVSALDEYKNESGKSNEIIFNKE